MNVITGREGKPRTGSEALLLRESGAPNADRIKALEQKVNDLQDEVNELRDILATLGTTLHRIL